MPPKQQDKESQQANQEKQQGRQQLEAILGKAVLRTLGQPVDFQRVLVRELWDHHYRVNVLVGLDAASVRIAHSYFLISDSTGNVLESTPKITKQY